MFYIYILTWRKVIDVRFASHASRTPRVSNRSISRSNIYLLGRFWISVFSLWESTTLTTFVWPCLSKWDSLKTFWVKLTDIDLQVYTTVINFELLLLALSISILIEKLLCFFILSSGRLNINLVKYSSIGRKLIRLILNRASDWWIYLRVLWYLPGYCLWSLTAIVFRGSFWSFK